ncbi:MAG: hypothetical protein WBW33_22160 [Bryobacteraceae bacterium]
MKLPSVLFACLLFVTVASACQGSTIQGYDPTAQTYTLSTTVTSQFEFLCCKESAAFDGSFTIQFFGLSPSPPLFFLIIPVTQTVFTDYPQLAGGTVCLDPPSSCYSPPLGGTRTLQLRIPLANLNTTPFSWTFSLTTDMYAQAHEPTIPSYWFNTTAIGTEVVDFGNLTLKDPSGNSLLSQGVTFEVTQVTPEPSSWALAGVGWHCSRFARGE